MNRHRWIPCAAFLLLQWAGAPAAVAQSCTNLCLQQTACAAANATTSISGTVFAPNGALPLPNVLVYVPNSPVDAMAAGMTCNILASGSPLVWTITNADGSFLLPNMPVGANIPLVIQAGKWRRQVVVPNVASCVDTPVAGSLTRLPQNRNEGDIPRIALLTSNADVPECTLRKIGIEDTEFAAAGNARIRLYSGTGAVGGLNQPTEADLTGDLMSLNQYDATILACQGSQLPVTQQQKDNLVAYVNGGGRVIASHEEHRYLATQVPFSTVAQWSVGQASPPQQTAFVDMTYPGGQRLAQWLQIVNASTTLGQINLAAGLRKDTNGVVAPTQPRLAIANPSTTLEFTFDTPVGSPAAQQCGRVMYRDMHSSPFGGTTGVTFPSECNASPMTPDEKLFAYALFDVTNFIRPALPLTVAYRANGATGGTVPVDGTEYTAGAMVTVRANSGALVRSGYTFDGWNTAPNGTGTNYAASGSASFAIGTTAITLYARWLAQPCSFDVDGNNAIDALTDGLIVLRAMFGLTGTAVTGGTLGTGASRSDWAAIRGFLNTSCGTSFAP